MTAFPKSLIPYNKGAEQAVLGSMMSQPLEVIDDVTRYLRREDFFVPAHQEVFSALVDMHEHASPIEVMLIHEYLVNIKMADAVGSPGILAELLVSFATHLNVGSYVKIVLENSMARKLLETAEAIKRDLLESGDQIAEIISRAETAIFDQSAIVLQDEKPFSSVIKDVATRAVEFSIKGGGLRGHSTGFKRLDELLSGWCPGQLVSLGGASGIGKTAMVITFARHLLRQGLGIGMWSGEMAEEQICNRILSGEGMIAAKSIFNGSLSEEQQGNIRNTAERLQDWPFYLNCEAGLDILQMRSLARRWKRKHNIKGMIIDHAQIARSHRSRDKVEEVSDISRNAKEMAQELEITVFLLSQLNCLATEVPTINSFKNSQTVKEDSDVCLLMHEISSDAQGSIREYLVNPAKFRDGARGYPFKVRYEAWRTHFSDCER